MDCLIWSRKQLKMNNINSIPLGELERYIIFTLKREDFPFCNHLTITKQCLCTQNIHTSVITVVKDTTTKNYKFEISTNSKFGN